MGNSVMDSGQMVGIRARELAERFEAIRRATLALCENLQPEDFVVQSMEDASPAKWHLAHVTWFFETFVLTQADLKYRPFHPAFSYLFNSYYVQAGERWQRPLRGLLSRPTIQEVFEYRAHVDQAMKDWLRRAEELESEPLLTNLLDRVEIGLNHEQQHQELFLTDVKHMLSANPLRPVYRPGSSGVCDGEDRRADSSDVPAALGWVSVSKGVRKIGFEGASFFYDNEGPRHQQFVPACEIASRVVTCGEYLEFMEDGGYQRPELWLSLGWAAVEKNRWNSPLYWERATDRSGLGGVSEWEMFTLGGMKEVHPDEPVAHVSFFEADAYARWRGCELPTEAQWETACVEARIEPAQGNFVDDGLLHPRRAASGQNEAGGLQQMYGDVWEWTASPYIAYPGYRPAPGALGEYNGKFMCSQMVLRGGSCATPRSHIRPTYRNFFPPEARWQFSGIRLARPETS